MKAGQHGVAPPIEEPFWWLSQARESVKQSHERDMIRLAKALQIPFKIPMLAAVALQGRELSQRGGAPPLIVQGEEPPKLPIAPKIPVGRADDFFVCGRPRVLL